MPNAAEGGTLKPDTPALGFYLLIGSTFYPDKPTATWQLAHAKAREAKSVPKTI